MDEMPIFFPLSPSGGCVRVLGFCYNTLSLYACAVYVYWRHPRTHTMLLRTVNEKQKKEKKNRSSHTLHAERTQNHRCHRCRRRHREKTHRTYTEMNEYTISYRVCFKKREWAVARRHRHRWWRGGCGEYTMRTFSIDFYFIFYKYFFYAV